MIIPLHSIFSEDDDISAEKRLIKELFDRYNKCGVDGRPVKNTSHPVSVQFGLGLIKLELMEKENMLYMSTWTRFVSSLV